MKKKPWKITLETSEERTKSHNLYGTVYVPGIYNIIIIVRIRVSSAYTHIQYSHDVNDETIDTGLDGSDSWMEVGNLPRQPPRVWRQCRK